MSFQKLEFTKINMVWKNEKKRLCLSSFIIFIRKQGKCKPKTEIERERVVVNLIGYYYKFLQWLRGNFPCDCRSREFLWQEGHTAFATKEEADKEVLNFDFLSTSISRLSVWIMICKIFFTLIDPRLSANAFMLGMVYAKLNLCLMI